MKRQALLILTIFSMIICTNCTQQKTIDYVCYTDKPEEINIATGDIEAYLLGYRMVNIPSVSDIKVARSDNGFYLLALEKNEGVTYAIPLEESDDKLFIEKSGIIHGCENDAFSLEVFSIVDGEIKACVDCNHRIMKQQEF
ncbi:MAG: hypothetical protein V2I47_13355 [Bacteroidales bacterium]|jgi:hypothetical protein|nr:hypothetical protein [Bacteroidales bacterium]